MLSVLPIWLKEKIENQFSLKFISEIRLRLNRPVLVTYKGEAYELKDSRGYAPCVNVTAELLNEILEVATKQSYYAFVDQIKNGYITTDDGTRIGLCGTVVYNGDKVSTIKNITSLNIRVPHEIENCSSKIMNFITANQTVKNTLIISPPGAGKTTMIRDIAIQLSERNIKNILVIDERFELFGNQKQTNENCLKNVDILSGADKSYGFKVGIKTLSPSVIVTDEISEEKDLDMLLESARSGVTVIATMHAKNIQDLKDKQNAKKIVESKIFERIVVLSKRNGAGTVEGIFDENLRCLFLPYLS